MGQTGRISSEQPTGLFVSLQLPLVPGGGDSGEFAAMRLLIGPAMPDVEIKTRLNGPYRVQGPIRLIDADGNAFDLGEQGEVIALCRCGQTKHPPMCDNTHRAIGFRSE